MKGLTSIIANRCPRQSLGPLLKGMKVCVSSPWPLLGLCFARLSSAGWEALTPVTGLDSAVSCPGACMSHIISRLGGSVA